jgi:Fe-Mn family superoxide dismutase
LAVSGPKHEASERASLLSRRDVLERGVVAFGGLILPNLSGCRAAPHQQPPGSFRPTTQSEETMYTLPPLPYAYDALEPHLSAEILKLHHDKHHQAYVDGANRAQKELAALRDSGDFTLIEYWEKKLAFHASGHLLHSLFWANMAPAGKGGQPSAGLLAAAQEALGGMEKLKSQLTAAAVAVEGSGWAMLGWDPSTQSLVVLQCENHQKLAIWGVVPLLIVDVWEHAYYLQYQNRRADFVKAWWNLVNWEDVSKRFAAAKAG